MTKIDDEKIQSYHLIGPRQFPMLVQMIISQDSPLTSPVINLEMTLCSKESLNTKKLLLKFYEISNLKLYQPTWSDFNILFLEITSNKNSQWEYINYFVKDVEEEILSFACKDFEYFIVP